MEQEYAKHSTNKERNMMIYKAIRVLCCLAILPNAVMAKFETRENNTTVSDGSTLFHCVDLSSNTYAAPPALAPDPATVEAETFPALCPDGQVPQPQDWFGPKGRLIPSSGKSPDMHQTTQLPGGLFYLYNAAYQYYNAAGTSASFTQNLPALATSDYHTLAEIAVESSDGRQIVEIGWTVDRGLNGGSATPHLFTFHWVNGNATCYNGCGYVQVSKTRHPGMAVSVTQTPQQYAIRYYLGKWWIGYQGEWIGYFPGSLWGGTYTHAGLTQWFGEVAAGKASPCTDMGNRVFGTNANAAAISNIRFMGGAYATLHFIITNSSYYNVGGISGPKFHYGGPGAC